MRSKRRLHWNKSFEAVVEILMMNCRTIDDTRECDNSINKRPLFIEAAEWKCKCAESALKITSCLILWSRSSMDMAEETNTALYRAPLQRSADVEWCDCTWRVQQNRWEIGVRAEHTRFGIPVQLLRAAMAYSQPLDCGCHLPHATQQLFTLLLARRQRFHYWVTSTALEIAVMHRSYLSRQLMCRIYVRNSDKYALLQFLPPDKAFA